MGFPLLVAFCLSVVAGGLIAVAVAFPPNPHSVKCQGCSWSGCLNLIKTSSGVCPKCGHSLFMYPKLTKVHETKDYPRSSCRYTFEVRKDKTLTMLLDEENQIWDRPVSEWWNAMSDEKWHAIDDFVEKSFQSGNSNKQP
jgi:hypothetical protein